MTVGGTSILSEPQRGSHIIYPYTDEERVVKAVAFFIGEGLRRGEAAVLVLSRGHYEPIRTALKEEGFDVRLLESSCQLAFLDADEMLEVISEGGMPSKSLFTENIAPYVATAEHCRGNGEKRAVRVYGEMVSLLWIHNPEAAKHLEDIWNDFIKQYNVCLLCTYALGNSTPTDFPNALIECHSHMIA